MIARVSSSQLQSAVSTLALIEKVDVAGNEILVRAQEDKLTLRVFSGSIVIESFLACDSKEWGECAVTVKTLSSVIKHSHDQDISLEFNDDSNTLVIRARKWKSKMPASLNVAAFEFNPVDVKFVSINSGHLFETLAHVNLMASINKHRVNDWEKGMMISYLKDEHMIVIAFGFSIIFAECRFKSQGEMDTCVIPFQSTKIMQKIIESSDVVEIGTDGKKFVVKTKKFMLQSPLINDMFPDYTSFFDQDFEEIDFNRKELYEAISRVNPMSEDSVCLTGEVKNDILNLSCNSSQVQSIDVLNVTGDGLRFCLNPKYLSHVLNSMESNNVTFHVSRGKIPVCVVSPKDEEQQVGIKYLLAQIREQ